VPKFGPLTALSLVRELRAGRGERRPIVVAGARELVPLLAKELRAGGDPTAVREGGRPEDAAVFVWIGKPDEAALRAASRTGVPIVGVTDGESLPYVLDTHLVFVVAGEAMPADAVARRIAAVLGELATDLAARLPAIREAVVDELVRSFSRRNALVGAAVWIPGADLPLLMLNQVRLVLRIAVAHGEEIDASRVPELAGVVGAGFALRTLARELLDFVPVAGWIVKGAVAYAGTRAIGEAAGQYFGSVRRGS
jgi:uncharacterized protein (DUF697 family)